ncbi:MAG: type VI secretion system protein TssA [Paracoccaceae bacterium]
MNIDVEALIEPFDGDSPCGEDLEYDPDFVELETLAKPKGEQQVGDAVIAGEAVDFNDVGKRALELLGRSKDLRIAVILAEAALHTDGFDAFGKVMDYIDRVLDVYWDTVHPMLDADDDDDPTMRVNAVRGLVGTDTVLRAVRWAPLTLSRGMGRFGLRHVQVAEGESPPAADMDQVPTTALINGAFTDTDPEQMAAIRTGITKSREALKQLGKTLDARISSQSPDLSALDKLLFKAQGAVNKALGGGEAEAPKGGSDTPAPSGGGAPRPSGGGGGAIASNDDVVRAIDRICEYYARYEPSSPVPLLMQRARRLVSADFMTIMKDMASGGVEQVSTISGISESGDY